MSKMTMEELFEKAEAEGLWFYTPYQEMWFSPGELREAMKAGRLRWGPPNWRLRDPNELINSCRAALESAKDNLRRALARVNQGRLGDTYERLEKIAGIIERVDNRCAAADGPVTPTNREITLGEIRSIYRLATGKSEEEE